MTPKEKAKDLFQKYYEWSESNFTESATQYTAKQCALLCVKEIITEINKYEDKRLGDIQYWTEVEYELNLL